MDLIDANDSGTPFNMAVETLRRVNNTLIFSDRCCLTQNFLLWKRCLDILYREVISVGEHDHATKLTKEEKEELNRLRNDIDDETQEYLDDSAKNKNNNRNISTKLPTLLDNFEIKLRMALDKKKMLMPSSRDLRYAIGNK